MKTILLSIFAVCLSFSPAAAQVPNSDCGEVWVEFFRCIADPACGPGQKYCTWVFNSEFCGTWDQRGCWPGSTGLASTTRKNPQTAESVYFYYNPLLSFTIDIHRPTPPITLKNRFWWKKARV